MLHSLARKHHTVHAGNDAQLQLWHARDAHTPASPTNNVYRRLCSAGSEVLGVLGGAGAGAAITRDGELAVVLGGNLHSDDEASPPMGSRNLRGSLDRAQSQRQSAAAAAAALRGDGYMRRLSSEQALGRQFGAVPGFSHEPSVSAQADARGVAVYNAWKSVGHSSPMKTSSSLQQTDRWGHVIYFLALGF